MAARATGRPVYRGSSHHHCRLPRRDLTFRRTPEETGEPVEEAPNYTLGFPLRFLALLTLVGTLVGFASASLGGSGSGGSVISG